MNIFGYKINREIITTFLLVLVGLSVFLPIKISSILIIIATVNCLFHKDFLVNLKHPFSNKINAGFLFFYLIIIVSAFLSNNQTSAISNVERRLVFLVFPILFSSGVTFTQTKKIVLSFCLGTFAAMVYCIGIAIYKSTIVGNFDALFYHHLSSSLGLNAIYLSVYVVFSIFAMLCYFNDFEAITQKWLVVIILFLSASLLLLSSKNLLIVLVLGVGFLFIKKFKTNKKYLLLLPVFLLLISQIKPVKERFLTEMNANMGIVKQDSFRYDTPFTGLTLRLVIWKNSIEILNENNAWLFGVGIGNFQDLLNQKYVQKGMYTGNPALGDTGYLGYNPHNQWVETLLALGIVGVIVLFLIMSCLWHYFYKQQHMLALLLLFIFLSVSLTESVISANKGIVFFTFFIALFSNSIRKIIS